MQIDNQNGIDEDALSRQLAVYGAETQMKLMKMRVYIHGLSGLGIEVAKNLILAGPKQVSIYDGKVVTLEDVSRNFYLKKEAVGLTTRAEACLSDLQELNPVVMVNIASSNSIDFIVNNFDCVVILDNLDKNYLLKLNKAVHQKNLGFIYAGNLGLYGFTFVDFGSKHLIMDPTGQECQTAHIAGITREDKGLVVLHEDKKHGFSDGDTVCLRQVKGMKEVNGKMFKIEVKSPQSFTIGNTSTFGEYQEGGIATEVKIPQEIQFDSLQKSLRCPYPPGIKELPIASWQKLGIPEQLHIILNALLNFYSKHQHIPRPLNLQDLAQMKNLVKTILNTKMQIEGQDFKVEEVQEKLIENVVLYADTQISPVTSFWGGIITQEIIKLTGKYTPLRQWLHHDFFQALPTKEVTRSPFSNNRYRDYQILFGSQFVSKAALSNTFLVGAGALGCEFIKMLAMMGFGTDYGGISVTDDDCIEISNLNRQFLFRRHHVRLNKCQTACKVGQSINPDCKFITYKARVSPDNEHIFNEGFWNDLDLVINAVDNVKARQYIDEQCVWFQKPLFESGTLGTKCHSQIILPHLTASYNDLVDPPEVNIPLCTLKNFPYEIQHTIQWARDYFEGIFAQSSSDLLNFSQRGSEYLRELASKFKQNPGILRARLESLFKLVKAKSKNNYETCVELALDIFMEAFNHQIKQLLICLPPGHISQETKKPFWSGLKRMPNPLDFNPKDATHIELIQAGANIYATMFDLPLVRNPQTVAQIAKAIKLPEFVPKANAKVDTGEKKQSEPLILDCEEDQKEVAKLLQILESFNYQYLSTLSVIEFEKDDPTNYHIEFMSAVANLRARNYQIEEVENFRVKLIAGKIIPAIATTTAMVVGAVGIEIIKYLQGLEGNTFKNLTANLALPLWVFNDIIEPIVYKDSDNDPLLFCPVKAVPKAFTKWDKLHIKGPLSVKQLKRHIQLTYKISVSMLTYGTSIIYPYYGTKQTEYMSKKVEDAYKEITGKKVSEGKRMIPLGVSAETQQKIYCQMPLIVYHR